MKIVAILISILLLTTTAYAQLTVNEEGYLKVKYELEKLLQQRADKISERDGKVLTETNKYNQAKQDLMDTYEIQIDAIEADITVKQGELNNIITP